MKQSTRAKEARILWDALFLCAPEERLSDAKQNHVILREPFERWWEQQLKLQGSEAPPISTPFVDANASRFAKLCEETFLPPAFFIDCEKLLQTKKQFILRVRRELVRPM